MIELSQMDAHLHSKNQDELICQSVSVDQGESKPNFFSISYQNKIKLLPDIPYYKVM
jgi:hypothetical protein